MGTTISMDILARDRASSTLNHIGDQADRSAARWHKMGQIAKSAGIMVGAGLAVAATAAVKLTKSAMEDQQAAVQLATAYRNNADAKRGEIAASEQWITAQGRALGVADDELRPALAQLVTATHDVGEAQKQASLAMNISAGRGIALSTVTKALEKAQNGSLTGLSRLGVKTKDAAGETLSLEQLTRKLSDTYRGQAAKAADTAAGKFGRLKLTMTETGEAIGYKLLPYAENLTDWILNDGVPMAEDLWAAWEDNGIDGVVSKIEALTDTQGDLKPIVDDVRKALGSAADIITGSLIPAVGDITRALPPFMSPLGLVADILGFMADHADLTKYALIGLTGVLTVNRTSMLLSKVAGSELVTSLTSQGTAAEKAAAKQRLLGSALRGAAGIGGMLALTASAEEGNKTLGALEKAAGGAAMGFAVGGPLGAAIGGTAGALWGAWDAGKATRGSLMEVSDALRMAVAPAEGYAASLDQITGAATRLTREQILQAATEANIIGITNRLGVNSRDVIGAVLGQEGATRRLTTAMRDNADSLKPDESIALNAWLRNNTQAFSDQAREVRDNAAALVPWKKALKGLPPEVRTRVKQIGADISRAQLRQLKRQYDLNPKQIQTIIKALGTEATVKKVRGVWQVMEDGKRVKPGTNKWADLFEADVQGAQKTARRGTLDLLDTLSNGTRGAKADLKPWQLSIRTAASQSVEQGRSGAHAVGAAMKAGLLAGFEGTSALLAAQARAAVRAAINAARAEAKIKSPSKETHYIGEMLAKGAADGMSDNKHRLTNAGADLMASIIKGIRKHEIPMQRVLDAVTNQVQRTIDRVKRLKDARAATVSDFKGFSTSLFAAEAPESGGFTVDSLLAFQVAERDKARDVRAAVIKLTGMGLSGSLIKQMQAGGSGGIEQLLALSSGNQAQINLANTLNAQTQAAYGTAGTNVANTMQSDDERQARRDAKLAKQIAEAVHAAIKDREARYEFVLRGNVLVAILKKEKKDDPSGGTP